MFNYEEINDHQIALIENTPISGKAVAGILIIRGMRSGLLTNEEGVIQLHNLFVAIAAEVVGGQYPE